MEDKPWDRSDRLVALLLVFLALAAFAKTTGHLFLLADDPEYTFRNEHVKAGLTGSGVAWAFRSVYALNWHPVTWLSHMLDVQLFGMNPAAHHLVNLLLHIANTVLLFDLLRRATGAREASAFVAAVFAVHPLHVESVAWVAERKDLLCGLFWLLAMRAYVRYVRLPGAGRYAAVLAFFALGLLSKAMIVTLPFLLLLLDYWPLGRFAPGRPRLAPIVEKIPFLILAAGTGIVTYLAQDAGGAVNALPFGVRAANGLTAYAAYLGKFIWPHPLAIYYPHPSEIGKAVPAWKAAGAFLLLAGATGTALAARKRRPWLLFGWLWFLVGLSPVIGIVQAGGQSMADRYMYMPIIGLLVLVAWESADRFGTRPFGGGALRTAALFSIAALAFLTWRQTDHWHDTVRRSRTPRT